MLYLVATPIGHPDDITVRALRILKEADVVVCESTKETSKLLKHHEIKANKYLTLNEHSTLDDLTEIVQLCETQNVVLVSDCGTPGFCDPGADLVRICHKKNIPYTSLLGPSSLMGLISLCGERLDHFEFRGFLPAENQSREKSWIELKKSSTPLILMDTPYRFQKLLSECVHHMPHWNCALVVNLSQESEKIYKGKIQEIKNWNIPEKAEFMILLLPTPQQKGKS